MHWNESIASGKMRGRRIEGVSKLLGRRSRPSDGGTSLVSEGRPCHHERPGPADLVAQRKNHGTIVPGSPTPNNGAGR